MINGLKTLAVIPARGGSKSVPHKNVRLLAGRPLIAWTIDAALRTVELDRIVVSTDSDEIANVARDCGAEVPFMRPIDLARDETPGIAPILHAVERVPGYDIVVALQPTSPLRESGDISRALKVCRDKNATSCISVCETREHPNWMKTLDPDGTLRSYDGESLITRRQDLPPVYRLNGAIYLAHTQPLLDSLSFYTRRTVGYVMPYVRSWDIDTDVDFEICEQLMGRGRIRS
jgi:N-acylneuraminate cytidylyltransferase